MATSNHIKFIKLNKDYIKEPVLIVGSKIYDYDKESIMARLNEWGFADIRGIDLFEGEGVDYIVDITDTENDFTKDHKEYFSTIICMEVLTHVKNPFAAANNIFLMLKKDGIVILSEGFVRKISKIPLDLWRFTYDGTKELFSKLKFDDSRAKISLTRGKEEKLLPLQYPLPQVLNSKHPDENNFGYLLRRVHRKFLANGIFRLSRLIPEITIYSIAKK